MAERSKLTGFLGSEDGPESSAKGRRDWAEQRVADRRRSGARRKMRMRLLER
jgi:hypothetical protein